VSRLARLLAGSGGVSCFVFVFACVVALSFRGCRRRVAAGGVGDGETGSKSLYNVGGSMCICVIFFTPPPPHLIRRAQLSPPKHHRFRSSLF
jgi:hypothetical protein